MSLLSIVIVDLELFNSDQSLMKMQVGSGVRIPVDDRKEMVQKRYTAEKIIGYVRTIKMETK